MWIKWMPWRFIVKYAAKSHGFLDPFRLMSYFGRFAQPAEVMAPVELMRAGAIFHARGLINSQAIQHNLDWVWPYWVVCQFDPNNIAFIPRSFSLTHINLTHRNWTAVGLPDSEELPLIDPRGLVTPFWDSWSIDSWLIADDGDCLIPSQMESVEQKLLWNDNLSVKTSGSAAWGSVVSCVEVVKIGATPICRIHIKTESKKSSVLAISLRPYNPEGVSFVDQIQDLPNHQAWLVDKKQLIQFNQNCDQNLFSTYREGDVYRKVMAKTQSIGHSQNIDRVTCDVGMATAAKLFNISSGEEKEIIIDIPLTETSQPISFVHSTKGSQVAWDQSLANSGLLCVPDQKIQFLYDAAVRTLVLHTANDIYAGPYTYKRFWFRDAVIIFYALMCAGLIDRAKSHLKKMIKRQKMSGYFYSQDGEWDSNGQVLWMLEQYCAFENKVPELEWTEAIKKAAEWILKKIVPENTTGLHKGLLKAGFSAEHLGPNDYFYWDDFWSVSGLNAASNLMRKSGCADLASKYQDSSQNLSDAIDQSLKAVSQNIGSLAMPTSPYRRLDSGSVGSIVVGYPLRLWDPQDARLMATVDYLWEHCLIHGGFFHDMSHSGINPYLTLHIAQVMLRAGDARYYDLVKAIAEQASNTGQWPEAIHPHTGGGCMGDGQHVWAAAEWILMIRNMFVREEGQSKLILCQGIPSDWIKKDCQISFGPIPTTLGTITIKIHLTDGKLVVEWNGVWHQSNPDIEIRLPGYKPQSCKADQNSIVLT